MSAEETNEEGVKEETPFNLETTFTNENGREYDVRVSVPVAHKFCRMHKIKLEGLQPLLLDISQILDLAYVATRSSKYNALGETKEQFLDGLDGESFNTAQACTVNVLVNFTLKTLPKSQARVMREEIRKAEELVRGAAELQKNVEGLGTGETSSESVEALVQTSTQPDTV